MQEQCYAAISNCNFQQPLSQQIPSNLNNAILKGQLDIQKAVAKEEALNYARMDLAQKKVQLQEYRKEVNKSRHERLVCEEDGSFKIAVENPFVKIPNREIANFRFISAFKLNSSEGDEGFFLVCLRIGEEVRNVYIKEERLGNITYLMKKITAIGGQIFTDSKKTKDTFWVGLCSFLHSRCKKTLIVPSHIGWIKDYEQVYRFVEQGEMLWMDIEKKAK